jgi:hypothetical protein
MTSALPPILTVKADIPDRQLRAISRLMHCNKATCMGCNDFSSRLAHITLSQFSSKA